MIEQKDLEAVEARATAARVTLTELCELTGVAYTTWWRWKRGGKVSIKKFRLLENKLAELEASS